MLLIVSIDPGYKHPGVTFSQIRRCAFDKEHFITLSEVSNLFNKTTYELLEYNQGELLGILPHLALFYPDFFDYVLYQQVREHMNEHVDYEVLAGHFSKVRFCIDRSAKGHSRSNKDAKGDVSILL